MKQFPVHKTLHVQIHHTAPSQIRLLVKLKLWNTKHTTEKIPCRHYLLWCRCLCITAQCSVLTATAIPAPPSPGTAQACSCTLVKLRASGWLSRVQFSSRCFPGKQSICAELCETGMGLPTGLWLCLGQDDPVLFPPNLRPPMLSPPFHKAFASEPTFPSLFPFFPPSAF